MNSPVDGARPLSALLRQLGTELRAQAPPAALQARVRAAVAAVPRPVTAAARPAGGAVGSRGARRTRWIWSGGAVFASLLAATVLLLRLPPPLPLVVDDGGLRYGAFVPVAPAERWPRGNAAAWLVGTELQRERLPALGLPYDPGRAGDTVRAELLLHPSGEVLAVRLLN